MKKIITTIILLIILIISIQPVLADTTKTPVKTSTLNETGCTGEGLCLNVPIGGKTQISGFPEYIQLWYNFVIGAVGIIATVIIMYAGFKWLVSRGNAGVISDSKEKIWTAIIGLFLAFSSYMILGIINKDFLDIGLPDLPKFDANQPTGTETGPRTTYTGDSAIFDLERIKAICEEYAAEGIVSNCDRLQISGPVSEANIYGSDAAGYWFDITNTPIPNITGATFPPSSLDTIITQLGVQGADGTYVIPNTSLSFEQLSDGTWRATSINMAGLETYQDTRNGEITAYPSEILDGILGRQQ